MRVPLDMADISDSQLRSTHLAWMRANKDSTQALHGVQTIKANT
jgi:hypothetical protein